MVYSVQQIKFECFSYIKEFGARMEDWVIGAASDPDHALFELCAVDRRDGIWMWKPALSATAAAAVIDFMTSRYQLERAALPSVTSEASAASGTAAPAARFVFMYKKVTHAVICA
jgi:hypothetical protein